MCVEDVAVGGDVLVLDQIDETSQRLAFVDGVGDHRLELGTHGDRVHRRLDRDAVEVSRPAFEHLDLVVADVAPDLDELGGVAGDACDLVAGLLQGGGGVDPEDPALDAGQLLEGGKPGDHPGVRRARHGADDDGVEEDPEGLLLLGDLERPVGEPQSAVLVLGGSGRDRIGGAAGLLDFAQGVFPRVADTDVEAGGVEATVRAHHPGEQDVADLVVHRVLPRDPLLLHETALHAQVGGDRGHLAGVVGLIAADRDQGVGPRGDGVRDDVLHLADLVTAIGQAGGDVLALGPDLGAAQVLGEAPQVVDRARSEGQWVAVELVQLHRCIPFRCVRHCGWYAVISPDIAGLRACRAGVGGSATSRG